MNQEVFKVVRGTEASILSTIPLKGYVYFALDTKKIFYGDGESFLPMGGNTGVWYGRMVHDETPEEGQVEFDFAATDIEGNDTVEDGKYSLPNIDDLIFNTPDGCFYRVVEIDKSDDPVLRCNRLTVAGSGGGSGQGGGSNVGYMVVSRIGDQVIDTLQGSDCYIEYQYTAQDAAGQDTGAGQATLYINNILKDSFTANQGRNRINVGPYLNIGTNNLRLVVSGNIGGLSNITQAKNWTVNSTSFYLTWNYKETTINTDDDFIFYWQVSSSLQHTTFITIDDLFTIEVPSVDNSTSKSFVLNRRENGIGHGAHKIDMYAAMVLGGNTFYSPTVSHNVIFVDNDDDSVIISVTVPSLEMNQYDTAPIGIVLYDPTTASTTGKVSAILRENGEDRDTWTDYTNAAQYYWNYTPTTPGNKFLSIVSGTFEKTIQIFVNDLGLTTEEVPGYDFRIKASDITSNDNLRAWSYGDVVPTFSEGFDWINCGLKSEYDENGNIRNYISIKAGNRISFNYKPFLTEKKARGFCFKVIFKATACRQYDAEILHVGSSEQDRVYLQLTANQGIFQPNGSDAITVPYCEDSYIELEFDIQSNEDEATGQRIDQPYILTWLDGVPAGVMTYTNSTTFFQQNAKDIIIGSDDCDVQLYMIKVYQKHLNNERHLTNFIMDASNANEIVARYNRNNILDGNGEISYQKLIEKNPNCDVYLYDIPRMTINKNDVVSGCSYQRYKGSLLPLQTAEGVKIAVQGTSSAAYGLSAFNFNSTFTQGFTDYTNSVEGEHIDNWSMDGEAIPIHDFNTKVNVASCEGVNNALNQEWYDRLVNHVYVTEYKKKNPKSRHTMQFMNMGVVFLKDNNPNTNAANGVEDNVFKDTRGYVNDPFYKMYSICNMGNIKRNTGVFSDPSNPYDVIMENPDNQTAYQKMIGPVDPETGLLVGKWKKAKFYPTLMVNTYELTGDSTAQDGKTYYARVKENDDYIYTPVDGLVVNESDVSAYYELKEAGSESSVEDFEWRARPIFDSKYDDDKSPDDFAWDYMSARNIKPATFNGQPNDKSMDALANQAWETLVAWFSSNNPDAATNEELAQPEHYDAYEFRGYTSIADRIDKDGQPMPAYTQENSILRGTAISRFAGDYTHDTYERRMAKMLSECEDHLIMDEIVFHYLFIERHAMVDNVAKNTFWHTEDLQHWSMIKDYDNDTADGNDNSGHLRLTYGYEVLDHVNHNELDDFVFNAPQSVWLHFIDGLIEARETVYKYLDKGDIAAWDAEPYLNLFEDWQSRLPERVWIEDYYRKYMRPKEVYNAEQFLLMLEGGKKTHQRRQFETYQETYMSSEYFGRKCSASMIDIRANGSNINTLSFPMQMYADCYIRIAAGSQQNPNVKVRYRRGQTPYIQFPSNIVDANDMTTYFYLAPYVTMLRGIETLKPKKVDISQATRLRDFSLGALDEDWYYVQVQQADTFPDPNYDKPYYIKEVDNEGQLNEVVRYVAVEAANLDVSQKTKYYMLKLSRDNLNLTSAVFSSNSMLENLEILNCPNAQNPLNLSSATNLKSLNIQGSGFKSITLASNAPIHTLQLNDPNIVTFKNLNNVSTFLMGYNNLNSLFIDNVDNSPSLNSKTLLDNQDGDLSYDLQNVQWVIDDSSEIQDGKITILEKLLAGTPYRDNDIVIKESALSGTLTITANAYNSADSLQLYERYAINSETNFPNLNIIFEGNVAKLHMISILDGNRAVKWTKKVSGVLSIDGTFLSSGPMGAFDLASTIGKSSTNSTNFEFTGIWHIEKDDGTPITTIDRSDSSDKRPYCSNISIDGDVVIYPEFIESTRQYTITFKNGDDVISSEAYDYGTLMVNILPTQTPRKDDSELDIYQTYKFKGYHVNPSYTNALSFTNQIVETDMTYYAIFSGAIDVNSHENVNYDYFVFENGATYTDSDSTYSITGYRARVKPGIKLSGKITIPAKYNNVDVITIAGFATQTLSGGALNPDFDYQTEVEGIFFETGTKIREIPSYAFDGLTNLKYFEIPPSLRAIRDGAFRQNSLKLVPKGAGKNSTVYYLGDANSNLSVLGMRAFDNCLDGQCTVLKICPSISQTTTDSSGSIANFNNCYNLQEIHFGNSTNGSKLNPRNNTSHPIKMNRGSAPPLTDLYFYVPSGEAYGNTSDIMDWINPYYNTIMPDGFNIHVESSTY